MCVPSHETFRDEAGVHTTGYRALRIHDLRTGRSDKNGMMWRSRVDVGVVVTAAAGGGGGGGDSYEDPWGPYGAPWYNVGNLIFRVINKRMRLCPPHKKLPAGQRARRPRFS